MCAYVCAKRKGVNTFLNFLLQGKSRKIYLYLLYLHCITYIILASNMEFMIIYTLITEKDKEDALKKKKKKNKNLRRIAKSSCQRIFEKVIVVEAK